MKTSKVAAKAFPLITFSVLCLITSCGGGGGSSKSAGGGPPAAVAQTGLLIDAPASGVFYRAIGSAGATQTGATGSGGEFSYLPTQAVTFSIGAGSGASIALGSITPMAPSSGNSVVFVGGINNGLQVAQTLQSLSHSASAGQIDVSGLLLGSTDVANLNAFISSGGSSTGTAASYGAMMQSAQASATAAVPSMTFSYPGGATTAQAAANLSTAAATLTPPASISVSGLYFFQMVVTDTAMQSVNYTGIDQDTAVSSGTPGTFAIIDGVTAPLTTSNFQTGTSTVSGNVLTHTRVDSSGTNVNSITAVYTDSSAILFNDVITQNGTQTATAVGVAHRLMPLAPSDLAGRTITFTDFPGSPCAPAYPQLAVSADGTTYTEYCAGSTTPEGTGSVTAAPSGVSAVQIAATPSSPGGASNSTHLLALASGTLGANGSGSMAFLTIASSSSGGANGLFAFTLAQPQSASYHVGGTVQLTYKSGNLDCVTLSLSVSGKLSESVGVGYNSSGTNGCPIHSSIPPGGATLPFTFNTLVPSGSAYAVAFPVATSQCALTNGSGTMGTADVANVNVVCQ